ncbi:MAG: zinc ribbon domain-containing protein [Planctomycetota bacterium]
MPRCPSCDHENSTGAELCRNCGARLGEPSGESLPARSGSTSDEAGVQAYTQDPSLADLVLAHLREGRKIQAIKVYREKTAVSLQEAKEAVEAIAAKHGITAGQGAGCAGVVLLAVVAGGTLAAWL